MANEDVGEQEAPEVPDVGGSVDRRTATVDPDEARLQRLEVAQLPGQRVVEADRHERSITIARAEIPRPAPSMPSRLPLEAFTLTAPGSIPRSSAMRSRIAPRLAPSRGRDPT